MKRRKLNIFVCLSGVLILFLLTGCHKSDGTAEKAQLIVDGSGREIKVPTKVDRVIPLVTGITGVLYDIGAGEKIVGVTKAAPYPTPYYYPVTTKLPDVGSIANINVEQVVSLKPDLIITTEFFLDAAKTLEAKGLTVVSLRLNSLNDIDWNIRFLGSLVGKKAEADGVAEKMRSTISMVKDRIKKQDHLKEAKVYVENSRVSTYGASSWCTESIMAAGGKNIYGDSNIKMPQPNFEYVIDQNPDVILLYVLPCENQEAFVQKAKNIIGEVKKRSGWGTISAVQNTRFCVIDDRYLDFGPNQVNSIIAMAKAFHPELFSDIATPDFSYISN